MQQLQTFNNESWKEGENLIKGEIFDKEVVHNKGLLHLAAHLLILDTKKRILCRKRKPEDVRYAGLWTNSIGVHVLVGDSYLTALERILPISKEPHFVGEFRVHDETENEINGLHILEVEENVLQPEFLTDKHFFTSEELQSVIKMGNATPHLECAYSILKKKRVID